MGIVIHIQRARNVYIGVVQSKRGYTVHLVKNMIRNRYFVGFALGKKNLKFVMEKYNLPKIYKNKKKKKRAELQIQKGPPITITIMYHSQTKNQYIPKDKSQKDRDRVFLS